MTRTEALDRLEAFWRRGIFCSRQRAMSALAALRFPPAAARQIGGSQLRVSGRIEWTRALEAEPTPVVRRLLRDVWQRASPRPPRWPCEVRSVAAKPTIGPTVAQWRAVRIALEKFFGLAGRPIFYDLARMPPFDITWDEAALTPGANACTVFEPSGAIRVCLRSSAAVDDLERSTLHELQHVADHELTSVLPRWAIEERAEVTAALLGPISAVSRRLDQQTAIEDADRGRRLRLAQVS
jgi:hypothetical protein